MKTGNVLTYPYNYYPNTMIALCVASYQPTHDIHSEVRKLGLEVVWGPAELKDIFGVSYSLMYIAVNRQTQEYTVVIRGTNPDSLFSWLTEDFDVGNTQAFNQLAPHAPEDARVSQATFNGMNDLLSLRDLKTGESATAFLAAANPRYLYVTGHSLGGTLTPALFAYLNDALYGGGYVHNMALWAFAGLTSGDTNFAAYLNSLFNPEFSWRIHNPLDIAPFLFYSQSSVENIYAYYNLPWSSADIIVRGILDGLFDLASGNNYTQPVGDQVLPAIFYVNEQHSWTGQAIYQHHATTYQRLVTQQYPVDDRTS